MDELVDTSHGSRAIERRTACGGLASSLGSAGHRRALPQFPHVQGGICPLAAVELDPGKRLVSSSGWDRGSPGTCEGHLKRPNLRGLVSSLERGSCHNPFLLGLVLRHRPHPLVATVTVTWGCKAPRGGYG